MKKVFLILLGILLSTNLVFAMFQDYFEGIKPGIYTCPLITKYSNTCVVELYKNGGKAFSNCGDNKQIIANEIKNNKCTFKPDPNKYYSCQYADGSCEVILGKGNEHQITCGGEVPPLEEVLKQAQNGKCYLDN